MDGVETTTQLKCNDKCNIDGNETARATKDRARAARKLSLAGGLCIIFMICEVIGGVISNSLAILTDAVHLLSDIAGFAIALFAIYASGWKANPRQTFGYYRVEILGALISIQLIWLITGVLVYEAILRFIHPNQNINGLIMFGVACGGLAVNIIVMCTLGHEGHDHSHNHVYDHNHDHGHDHNHNHSHTHAHNHDHAHDHDQNYVEEHNHKNELQHEKNHQHDDSKKGIYTKIFNYFGKNHHHHHQISNNGEFENVEKKNNYKLHNHNEDNEVHEISIIKHNKQDNPGHRTMSVKLDKDLHTHNKMKEENINVRAAYLHALGDFVQSIGVMIAGAIIWFKPDLYIVDPICTIVFSIMVLATTYNMIKEIVSVLMESTPREIDASALEANLLKLNGVVEVHELHIWAITVGRSLLACHIQAEPQADTNEVLHIVTQYVENVYNISHVTIQVEQRLS